MHKRYFWSISLMSYVGFMSGNSPIPAMELSTQSMSALQLVTSVIEAVGLGNAGATEHFIREAARFSEYALSGILLAQCLVQYGLLAMTRWQLHGPVGFLAPSVDETLQLLTEGHSRQISDVWLDYAGVLFGTMLFLAAGR